ncbi:signal peptidase I [Thermococcus sp.]|uniref:signal peptidase I n=1 Tax=Thermococcus sp. TaxID=35749 RepID=UPI00261A3810|nr:signal peptidase I [Thermococcus sp.]
MRKLLENIVVVVATVFLLASVTGFLLGRPVLLSYAYSESMTPTINKGDMFFINPLSKGGKIGDIIVFHRGDGWTVHRVFAITEKGYVTKGDNNVATDQQNGENPLVRREDVIGKVVELGGRPLIIRGGGAFIESLRARLTSFYAVVIFLLAGAFLTFSGGDKRDRGRRKYLKVRAKTLYAVVSIVIIAGFLFVTVASWGTLTFTYSSTLAGGQREGWYLPGSTFERNVTVKNSALYPFHYFITVSGGRVELLNGDTFEIPGRGTHEISLRISVPKETRIYKEEITVHSYPSILPGWLVASLYNISPYLPLLPYAMELAGVLVVFYYLADVGRGDILRIRVRRRSLLAKIMGDG